MTRTRDREAGSAVPTVDDLLAQRSQILGWLSRLDEVGDAESRRVVDRVRDDYQRRLESVLEELSAHVESLRTELAGASERRQRAEQRHAEADDALGEARLRHRIGELDGPAWEARRSELEAAVQEAAAQREEAAAEVARLEEILGQIASEDEARAPVVALPPTAEAEEPAPQPSAGTAEADTLLEPPAPEGDLAFLEELDRAIAASDESTDPHEAGEEGERAPKGVKCPDCGYTNDVEAWYCGVCGVDLA
jgi:hypothetical protein